MLKSVLRLLAGAVAVALITPTAVLITPTAPAYAATVHTKTPVAGTLSSYRVSGVYVAGVSSGAYLATQLQVAYSQRIRGAALFAAGPYYCAQNNVAQALYGCGDNLYPTYLSALQTYTRTWAGYGWIDPVSGLSGEPVYVFHGRSDSTVKRSVSDDLVRYQQHFGANVQYDNTSSAGHGWVTRTGRWAARARPHRSSTTAAPTRRTPCCASCSARCSRRTPAPWAAP